jgi:4'-phosphopantetheinyl transferase EntD
MLNNEEEIDMKTAYEAKEVLYKAQSYLVGYKLGYTDVTLNYSELKDLEYLIGLYESGDLFDLVDKYNNV